MVSNSICRGRALKISIGITMLVLLLAGGASSATLTVCQGGCDYTSIQTAINAASNGDTILVAAGIYNENVIVNKSVNLTGAGADVTIVKASDPNSHVFFVSTQNGVNISGFTVTGGTGGIHPLYSAGIILSRTNNTNLSNNNVSNNFYGIYLFSAINTNLSNNHVNSNNYGIYTMLSSKNIITNNTIASNNIYGLSSGYSNNTIYNNFFNNTNNFDTRNTYTNIWNTTKQTGTNIVGGPNLGGNFWGNPSGRGFSQICTDANLDGICDSSYMLSTINEDYLPLAIPTGYINGSVKYNNTGIPGAVVAANTCVSTTTDTSGFYSFQLHAGTYQQQQPASPNTIPTARLLPQL